MKNIILIIFTLIFMPFANSQNREAYNLKLNIDNENFYETPVPTSPYIVKGNKLQLYTGEKVLIEATIENERITTIQVVEENRNPQNTIEVELKQVSESNIHKNTMLIIKNPFSKDLNYQANIFLMNQEKWLTTKVNPVVAKKTAYELWPDIIVTIVLSEFQF